MRVTWGEFQDIVAKSTIPRSTPVLYIDWDGRAETFRVSVSVRGIEDGIMISYDGDTPVEKFSQ